MNEDTPAQIDADYKSGYAELQGLHARKFLSLRETAELDQDYHARHTALIDERKKAARLATIDADNVHVCEVCLKPLPIKRGRPARRHEECK